MRAHLMMAVAIVAACGGGGSKQDTTPDEEVVEDEGGGGDSSAGMIEPERMDEIQHTLDRKRTAATRCLTDAIERGEAAKNARGKVTVEFVIGSGGQARDVEVVKTSKDLGAVHACIVDLVGKIDFGALERDLEWSYTFAFEAF